MSSTITRTKIKNRDNLPVKYKGIVYPQPKALDLAKMFFVCLCIGARQSGKTVSTVKLLKYYETEGIYNTKGERVPIRTIIISPTFHSNPIYLSLTSLDVENDVHEEYSDKLLLEILADIEAEKEEIEEYEKQVALYKKFLKVKKITDLTPLEMVTLQVMNFEPPVQTSKYKCVPVYNLILDDLIGTNTFKAVGASAINNLVIKNRHKGINIFILAQSAKQIPKIIRINSSLLFIYRYNSDKMLDDLFEVVSGVVSLEEFKRLYDIAVAEKYNFLNVDCTKKDTEFRQNFDHLLEINKKSKIDLKVKKVKTIKNEITTKTD